MLCCVPIHQVAEVDILKEIEKDGKEVPLGTVLKILKAKGAKERKAVPVKSESTPAAASESDNNNNNNNNNNVDILGMVKEINLDNSDMMTNKLSSMNGTGDDDDDEENKGVVDDDDEKRKRKRTIKHHESTNVSVSSLKPKRQKSSSKGLSAFENIKMIDDEQPHTDTVSVSENKVSSEDHIQSTDFDEPHNIQTEDHGNPDDTDHEVNSCNEYLDSVL